MVMFNSYVKLAEGMKKIFEIVPLNHPDKRTAVAGHDKKSPNVWQRDNEHSVFQIHNVGL